MSEKTCTLAIEKTEQWREILTSCEIYDIYHLPGYHRLAEEQDGGDASLFVFESGSMIIAMPLLIRPVEGLPAIESSEFFDATSVYGYPGPVSNIREPPDEMIERFNLHLRDYLVGEKVISAFSRLHPLLHQEPYLKLFPQGEILDVGPTVAIDLRLPVDVQWQKFRCNHKRDINKAKRQGAICVHDEDWSYLGAFIDIYYDTMRYHDADGSYLFNPSYFVRLHELLKAQVHLFVVLRDNTVLSGGLFTLCNGIIQYHLGGTNPNYRDLAPSKLMFDTVRLWGGELGAHTFHLGGGLAGQEDSLFHFKAGFSDMKRTFQVWRAVINEEVYRRCVGQRRAWDADQGLEVEDDDFFPLYRAPRSK